MITYTKKILQDLFDGQKVSPILPYDSIEMTPAMAEEIANGSGHISLSGAQPKFAMVVDNGQLRFTKPNERGTYILKPAPTARFILERAFCPANEYLTMQLARFYGIETAKCALCQFKNGEVAYLTRRFDIRADGGKFAQEDLASVAGLNKDNAGENYKYDCLSYEECASLIAHRVKAASVEVLKFFRMVVFNYLVLNDDAHLKNFSLIELHPNDYVLAPAYDLMNTNLHLYQPSIFALRKGLFKEGTVIDDTHSITYDSFVEFGRRIGLSTVLIEREMKRMSAVYPQVEQMIQDSMLSEALKKHYLSTYIYRRTTITQ